MASVAGSVIQLVGVVVAVVEVEVVDELETSVEVDEGATGSVGGASIRVMLKKSMGDS